MRIAEYPPEPPEIWAHRGARAVAPENTLAAGEAALAQGAGGWEVDVRLTADCFCVLLSGSSLVWKPLMRERSESTVRC